jgi:hypothetical protein
VVGPTDRTKTGQGGGPGLSEDDRSATFEASEENRSRPLACIGLVHHDSKSAAQHEETCFFAIGLVKKKGRADVANGNLCVAGEHPLGISDPL